MVIQERVVHGARVFLLHLGEGRLRDISLHFAPRTAFILLDRQSRADDGRSLASAIEAMRAGSRARAADLLVAALSSYMSAHALEVRRLSVEMGRKLRLDDLEIRELGHAAVLHDVGKILVPGELLSKKGLLSPEERTVVQRHAAKGAEILQATGFPEPMSHAVAAHHERVDGRGYPLGLAAGEIPLASRIIAVADAFDVMTKPRAYGRRRSVAEALAELSRCAERQFDTVCVEALRAIQVARPRIAEVFAGRAVAPLDRLRPVTGREPVKTRHDRPVRPVEPAPVGPAVWRQPLFRPSRAGGLGWISVPAAG
jgi:putative nucleotidyltransferase with HDIG domain